MTAASNIENEKDSEIHVRKLKANDSRKGLE
jgi:hypothetical protein